MTVIGRDLGASHSRPPSAQRIADLARPLPAAPHIIPWQAIALAIVAFRLFAGAMAAAAALNTPGRGSTHSWEDLLVQPWQQFDANHFIAIATHGYQAGGLNTAYMPLYPLLLRLAALLTGGQYLWTGLALSLACLVVATGLFWRWAADHFDAAVAWRAVGALLLFPDSFYLAGVYSEALCLALSAGCLLASDRDRPLLAGWLAAAATLTRLQGLVLLVPMAFACLRRWRATGRAQWTDLGLLLAPAALFAWQKALAIVVGGPGIVDTFQQTWHIRLQPPWETIRQYVAMIRSPQFNFLHSHIANYVMVWDLVSALLVLAVIIAAWKRLGLELACYGLAAWGFAMTRWYSTGRYMLAVLPFFLAVALLARGRAFRLLTACSLMLMVFFLFQFAQGSWID